MLLFLFLLLWLLLYIYTHYIIYIYMYVCWFPTPQGLVSRYLDPDSWNELLASVGASNEEATGLKLAMEAGPMMMYSNIVIY